MNAPTPRGRKARRVALSPESLEDRTVPAGNVLAFLNNGVLHVWGDGADNRVWLAGAGEDAVVVATLDGTTVNGGRTPVRFEGVGFAYDVQLRDGNDFLLANDLHGSASLFVQAGDGNDGVAADRLRLDGSYQIHTGTGDDTVSAGLGKMKWGAFVLGAGDDRMQVFGTEFGDVVFSGGTGAGDTISVVSVRWGSFPHTSGFESVFGSHMPVANNDTAQVDHGESVTINVLANDQTAGGGVLDPSSVRITKQPEHGTVTVNDNGTVTYTSDDNSTSPRDSFRYTVRSSTGAVSNEATVTLVLPVIPDTTAPTPTITTPGVTGTTTKTSPIPFQVKFSENVTGFELADVTVTNGTASNFVKVDDSTYTFSVTPAADGEVTVSLAAGAAEDKKGNDSTAASKSVTFDTTGPTTSITSTEGSPTNADPIPVTVTFSEAVTEFLATDVTVTNGTVQNFQGSGTTYTFNVAPAGPGTVTVEVAGGVAKDAADNPNQEAPDFTIVFDSGAPSVTLSTSAGSPTNLASIPFTATFSEPVNDFTLGDITVTNGSASNFQTGANNTFTFDVAPAADGDVTVSIAAGAATDQGGNPSTAATPLTRTSDRTAPTATVTTNEPEPTSNNPIPFAVTFSESVNDFTAGDVLVVNGAVINFAGSGANYTFDVVPSGNGVVVEVSVPAGVAEDAAANGNTVSNTATRTFSGSTVSTDLTTAAGDPTDDSPIQFSVTFGEAVTGFALGDINVTNGTASNLLGSSANYTFDVTPTADGPVVVSVAAGAATGDVSGDPTSADQVTVTSDTTDPVVTNNTTSTDAVTGTSSDASGVTGVQVSISDGTNFWSGSAFDSATEVFHNATSADNFATWSFAISADGTFTVHSVATDAAGNTGEDTDQVTVS